MLESANLIIVGGPISVGKSTLVSSLPWPSVPELDNNDEIQKLLLENTYKKGRVHPAVIENHFLQLRRKKYEDYAFGITPSILDRSIFESLWFAKGNMKDKTFKHFKTLWSDTISDLIKEFGKPKIYILLTCSWDVFKERLFKRARQVEISNFSANEDFFKLHIKEYESHMIEIFEKFKINYLIINTDNMTPEEIRNFVMKKVGDL